MVITSNQDGNSCIKEDKRINSKRNWEIGRLRGIWQVKRGRATLVFAKSDSGL